SFAEFSRRVDPLTGMPLDARGRPLTPDMDPDHILRMHPGNRQLFDVVCSATVGIAAEVLEELTEDCLVDLLNSETEFLLPGVTPANALGAVFTGTDVGSAIAGFIAGGGLAGSPIPLIELNHDPNDGGTAGTGVLLSNPLGYYLTDQQEALLGCGPFYGLDCDEDGIDLFNAEASVLLQSYPQFPVGGAVATRDVNGLPVVLPGARGVSDDINRNGIPDLIDPEIPVELRYSPLVDGCTGPGVPGCEAASLLVDPRTGEPFPNEMAALSYTFLQLIAAISAGTGTDPDCKVEDPITCSLVRGVFNVAGSTQPEVRAGGNGRFGRRDFIWHGGSEIAIRYEKRHVLGFSFDFAEDRTKTN